MRCDNAAGAPKRIWMPPLWEVGDGTIPTDRQCEDDDISYILESPTAIAASPEVQRMILEAEARGMERAAKLVEKRAEDYDREFGTYDYTTGVTEYPGTGDESMEEWESISTAIRAEAAAIKGDTK